MLVLAVFAGEHNLMGYHGQDDKPFVKISYRVFRVVGEFGYRLLLGGAGERSFNGDLAGQ